MKKKDTYSDNEIISTLNAIDDMYKKLLILIKELNQQINVNIVWDGQTVVLSSTAGAQVLENLRNRLTTVVSNIIDINNTIQQIVQRLNLDVRW